MPAWRESVHLTARKRARVVDGSDAECTVVPASSVVPFISTLEWVELGAIPEMPQTAHGSHSTEWCGPGGRRR